MAVSYVECGFENASPLQWEVEPSGALRIGLLYDYERGSSNRAAGHWHFRIVCDPGEEVEVHLENFDNIWNGRPGSPISDRTPCFISSDGREWAAVPARKTDDNRLVFRVRPATGSLCLARLEPYRISDLDRLIAEIHAYALVEIETIGQSVEGRDLEIIRVGRLDAPRRFLIRARSHPWEPGGNWVVQGLIRALLSDDGANRDRLGRFNVAIMPMAAKDGVARGWTRFNSNGMDLNRDWEEPADPGPAPENAALERWLESEIEAGRKPDLEIDLHNDNSGRLHPSAPTRGFEAHQAQMERLEQLLRRHTWFTEGRGRPDRDSPWTFGEGLIERYGIEACVLELNCDWIAGLDKVPFGSDWEQFGAGLAQVFDAWA